MISSKMSGYNYHLNEYNQNYKYNPNDRLKEMRMRKKM